ncbi:MAG: FhaA domain-containing protein, partial [Mycobacteriales bacterium]
EGAFAKVFKGEVHPREIALALQREVDDRKAIVSEDRVLIPNDFVVELSPRDYDRLAPYAEPLAEELIAMLREHASEQGYSFVGPVKLGFELVDELDTGFYRVRSDVVAPPRVDGAVVTRAAAAHDPAPRPHSKLPGNPRLLLNPDHVGVASPEARARQRAFPLNGDRIVLGRSPDCDLQLTDPGVSRRHAELRLLDGVFVLEDLGSTNGTLVNNVPVGDRQLVSGDRIRLGSTTLIFERDEIDSSS